MSSAATRRKSTRDVPDFRRILVPTDLTARTTRSFDMACRLAAPGGTVTLLHVVALIQGLPVSELEGFYQKLERRARTAMAAMARRASGEVSVEVSVSLGSRAEEIVRVAAANRSDLIVLGSHRVHPGRAIRDWGTISYKVGLLARCPVLLIK
jgi:nucleotide-binding universal stress UspA family protein